MPSSPGQTLRQLQKAGAIERIAYELFHDDVLAGRSTTSATWEGTPAHEQAVYLADARAALRRLDAVALSVAKHRAVQAAAAELAHTTRLTDVGREQLKAVIKAALDAHHAHLSREDDSTEVAEYEQIVGLPPTRDFAVIDGGRQ